MKSKVDVEVVKFMLRTPQAYLRKHKDGLFDDVICWRLFSKKATPEATFQLKQLKPLETLLRRDKKGEYRLDLRAVQRLHGHNRFKRAYLLARLRAKIKVEIELLEKRASALNQSTTNEH